MSDYLMTRAGQKLTEVTLPRIATAIEQVSENLAKMNENTSFTTVLRFGNVNDSLVEYGSFLGTKSIGEAIAEELKMYEDKSDLEYLDAYHSITAKYVKHGLIKPIEIENIYI